MGAVMRFLVWVVVAWLGLAGTVMADGTTPADEPEDVTKGVAAFRAEDYATARRLLLPWAEKGQARAQGYIGYMTLNGLAFKKNSKSACDWFEKSALQNNASSQISLATCFLIGQGRHRSTDKAISWLEPAAKSGRIDAQYKLALAYDKKGDVDSFERWAKAAANRGNKDAKLALILSQRSELAGEFGLADLVCTIYATWFDKPVGYCDD